MTENLFQRLEEKMMTLISEVEVLRKEMQHLTMENASLKMERENHARKLQELISLLDTVGLVSVEATIADTTSTSIAA